MSSQLFSDATVSIPTDDPHVKMPIECDHSAVFLLLVPFGAFFKQISNT